MSFDLEHWSSPNGCHQDCPACAAETALRDAERKRIADFCAKLTEQGHKQAMTDAQRAGCVVEHDTEAATVTAVTRQGDDVFLAIGKGGGAWIVIYFRQFYTES